MKYHEFIEKLDDDEYLRLKEYPMLIIDEVSTMEDLSRGKKDLNTIKIEKNEIWLGCRCLYKDIAINTCFNLLIAQDNVENHINVNAKLISIYMRLGQLESLKIFPNGYYSVCLIRFENLIPDKLNTVRRTNEKFDINKNKIYFLTQDDSLKKHLSKYI